MNNIQKAAVIGCGFVGSSIAFTLMQSGIFSELVLIDANRDKAEGEAMDLSHGLPFTHPMDIRAGDYDDVADCALVIVTAGAGQKPGETRLDLVHKNVAIFRSIIPEIARRNRDAILLIVSNPVDVLTWAAWKLSGYPANRVLGSGTVLDTARLKYLLGERLGVDSRSVRARGQRAGGVERGQRVRHLPGSLLRAAGLLRARQGRRVAPAGGAGQRL